MPVVDPEGQLTSHGPPHLSLEPGSCPLPSRSSTPLIAGPQGILFMVMCLPSLVVSSSVCSSAVVLLGCRLVLLLEIASYVNALRCSWLIGRVAFSVVPWTVTKRFLETQPPPTPSQLLPGSSPERLMYSGPCCVSWMQGPRLPVSTIPLSMYFCSCPLGCLSWAAEFLSNALIPLACSCLLLEVWMPQAWVAVEHLLAQ